MNFTKTESKDSVHLGESEIVKFRGSSGGEVNLEQIEKELFGDTNSTPLGQLLEMIGSLPDIRQEKVYNIRDRLDTECYDMDHTLDWAIDKVLEELLSDN
ncbi:MAG: hypothetical protein K9M75_05310 [Phycisphaerae bacterium]|nr:hypothetical protein [Phycisphaerae bacterium]